MRRQSRPSLNDPVRYLTGVGPKKAEVFASLGVHNVHDLLNYFPFRLDDFSRFVPIDMVRAGEDVTVAGKVISSDFTGSQRGQALRVRISDGRGVLSLVWYNMPYMQGNFTNGREVLASGKAEWRRSGLEMAHPVWQLRLSGAGEIRGPVIPVYHSTANLSSPAISKVIRQALSDYTPLIRQEIPPNLLNKRGYVGLGQAYRDIHDPPSASAWNHARQTLAFREMLYLQMALLAMREEARNAKGPGACSNFTLAERFIASLPFTLTSAQEKAIADIRRDLAAENIVMSRLLQGDVGSGKTVVALYAMLAAKGSGFQAALLAPTEVLAGQHFATAKELCGDLAEFGLLTGSTKMSDRKKLLEELADGKIDVLIGTHAMLEPSVAWKRLGIVVTDEQHRFGVRQRLTLLVGAEDATPHVLVMSATPIPRSLALTLYGDLDVSIIDTMPPGRVPVTTVVLDGRGRREAYRKVREEVAEGRQAYVVCPLIREGQSGRKAAEAVARELAEGPLKGLDIGLIHGDLPRREIADCMAAFLRKDIHILVSTTVIEVGIDVPNATVMVVEDADSFGLATLHQLRGRVGRGQERSYCYLIASAGTEAGRDRLNVMETLSDGFQVAEADLSQRGPGQFFGMAQHGLPEVNIADLQLTLGVVSAAREEAKNVASALTAPNPDTALVRLAAAVRERFGDLYAHSRSR